MSPAVAAGVAGRADALSSARALAARQEVPVGAVAREFEALLVGELLRAATRPLPGVRALDGGSAGRMYREQFLGEVARLAAERGGFGLAALLEARLGGAEETAR